MNDLPPLTRLLMIAEELTTAADSGAVVATVDLEAMADVLVQVHNALAGTAEAPTREVHEETDE